ncbi:MAG: cytochrome ubiquinol oxidase subunit I [Prevotellaceae bacterium]|jgi:cytochrome d ubiquinol oxidase subunit I|nr:cytochrome ubiquinol oxidase subunit I [Prevotellaceae bacterium]
MIAEIDNISLIDWSRAQFALTAFYHWLFVPLTLGLGIVQAVMETIYYKTGDEFWKKTAQFWMKLFGINFAIGVATGLILEFEFGTNWSNYSWFVGDIFGAPLAIEGVVAFFMEATFIAVMFFGWNKVSKGFHLTSTWLTIAGATISAFWILVANGWMQYPTGMVFNPDTVRNEMGSFWAVAFSPVALNKFLHTVLSGWIIGAMFVAGISSWYLLRKREVKFALASIKVAVAFGLIACFLSIWTGDGSASQVAKQQPMKLAAMEGLYEGGEGVNLVGAGILNPSKKEYNDNEEAFLFKIDVPIPKFLSYLAFGKFNAYVPGIKNIIEGGYTKPDGSIALSAEEKIARGKLAINALANYKTAKADSVLLEHKADSIKNALVLAAETENYTETSEGDTITAIALTGDELFAEKKAAVHAKIADSRQQLKENFAYFGYGYIKEPKELIPPLGLTFYAFRVMVILGGFLLLLFAFATYFSYKNKFETKRWLQWTCLISIFLAIFAGQAGWVVAEVGRQPWAIQDILPTSAAISKLSASSVQLTFFIFLVLFTVLLIAELKILTSAIKKGPQINENKN